MKTVKNMKRDEAVLKAMDIAVEMCKSNTGLAIHEREAKLFDFICSWNHEHYDETEIFGCEHYDENDKWVGFGVEDDYFLFEDEF